MVDIMLKKQSYMVCAKLTLFFLTFVYNDVLCRKQKRNFCSSIFVIVFSQAFCLFFGVQKVCRQKGTTLNMRRPLVTVILLNYLDCFSLQRPRVAGATAAAAAVTIAAAVPVAATVATDVLAATWPIL
jgi:hypothetical protein